MRRCAIGATAIIIAALTSAALAQSTDTYPDRPIKVVVPAAAGGVTDTPARVVTNRMRDNIGQSFVIENQGGAGGILAAESVKRAAPDGYTLLYVNAATHGLLPALKKSLSYDALKDFVPVAMAVRAPLAIAVKSDSRYRTLADLVKGGSEAKPLNYGSPGPGNTSHLIGLMLTQESKTPMQAVHYRGEAPMIQDLISGYYAWSGFVAPAGTPQAIVDRLNRSANIALAEPEVIKALTANGFEIVGGKPEIFAKAMDAYISDVSAIGKKNNLEIE